MVSDKYDMDYIQQLLAPDSIYLPKAIASRKDISDEGKLFFGEVITKNRFETYNSLKNILLKITDSDIENEFGCNQKIILRVKSDIKKICDEFDTIFSIC